MIIINVLVGGGGQFSPHVYKTHEQVNDKTVKKMGETLQTLHCEERRKELHSHTSVSCFSSDCFVKRNRINIKH